MTETLAPQLALMSDLHIGAAVPNDDLLGADRFAWVDALSRRVLEARPVAVLIAGDLFDRRDESAQALEAAQDLLDSLTAGGRPVCIISGNHDAVSSLPAKLQLPRSVHWFGSQRPSTRLYAELGLAVHGVSVAEGDDLREVTAGYPAPIDGVMNIAMLHTSLDGTRSKRTCLPVPEHALVRDERYDAWLLGHVHERIHLSEEPLVLYPGSPHPRHMASLDDPGFALLDLALGRQAH